MGWQVTLITNNQVLTTRHANNNSLEKNNETDYCTTTVPEREFFLDNGVRVIQLKHNDYFPHKIANTINRYPLYSIFIKLKPDIIMIHGLGNISYECIRKYQKKHFCKVIADTHIFKNNSSNSKFRHKILRYFEKRISIRMKKYVNAFFGVSPATIIYAKEVLGLKNVEFELLPLGYDDWQIKKLKETFNRNKYRELLGLSPLDIVIVHGGKLNPAKGTDALMEAIGNLSQQNIKLIVFGQATRIEYWQKLLNIQNKHKGRIILLGELEPESINYAFLSADMAVFPGTQSVLWQQAMGAGLPAIFRYTSGIEYLDIGGNCKFLEDGSIIEIQNVISKILNNKDQFECMKTAAKSDNLKKFAYSSIAKRLLGEDL